MFTLILCIFTELMILYKSILYHVPFRSIDVLAMRHCHHCHEEVGVIGHGGVDCLEEGACLGEHLAEVLEVLSLGILVDDALGVRCSHIDIVDAGHFDNARLFELGSVLVAAIDNANQGKLYLLATPDCFL